MDQLEELRNWTKYIADGLTAEQTLNLPSAIETLAEYTSEDLTLANGWW